MKPEEHRERKEEKLTELQGICEHHSAQREAEKKMIKAENFPGLFKKQ